MVWGCLSTCFPLFGSNQGMKCVGYDYVQGVIGLERLIPFC